jgi:hypothetical protein
MDNELKRYLDAMSSRMQAVEQGMQAMAQGMQAMAQGMQLMDQRMQSMEQSMQSLEQRVHASEERLTERIRDTETALLTEFHKWASPIETRPRTHSSVLRAIDADFEYLQDRVKKLESKN